MKTLARTLILVILLAGTLTPLRTQAQDDNQPWPFIYYYSYYTHSWIIERADGSDGFKVGAGLNCGMIMSADWSPSGRWLLWHCENREYNFTNRQIAVSADNTKRVTTLDMFNDLHDDYAAAHWSPTQDDLLAVNTIYRPTTTGEAPEWGPGVYIIDANQDKLIRTVEFDTPIDRVEWSPDGQFVLAYDSQNSGEESAVITVIPVNGNPVFTHEPVTKQAEDNPYNYRLIWTPNGRLIDQLEDSGELVLEDLYTGEREKLPFTTTPMTHIWFSPDNQYGLIYAGMELWLYTISGGTLEQIADHVIPIPTDPNAFDFDKQPSFQLPAWSPDSSRALFATQDGSLHWLETDGTTTSPNLPSSTESPVQIPRVQWGGDQAFILWNNSVYIYDLATENTLTTFTKTDYNAYGSEKPVQDAQVSPDGRYLAHPLGDLVGGYYIWDWEQDIDTNLPPNPLIEEVNLTMEGHQARWYPNQDILFVGEPANLAGPGLFYWSVASADGRLIRVLSSADSDGAPQGLPDRVDTSFIPSSTDSLVPSPSLQIIPKNTSLGMLSWSPDGRYLASTSSNKDWQYSGACVGGHQVRIYDAQTGEMITKFQFESCGCGYVPQTNPNTAFRGLRLSPNRGHSSQSDPSGQVSGYPLSFAWPQTDQNTVLAMPIYECGKYKLLLWDFTTDKILAEYEGVRAVAFSHDGTQVALGYEDGRVVLTTYPDMKPQYPLATLPTDIDRLVFNEDASRLAVTSINDDYNGIDGELSVWNTTEGTAFFRTTPNPATDSLGLTPDGKTLIIAAQNYRCHESPSIPPTLMNAATGDLLNELNTSVNAAAISPDGRYFATTGCGIEVWDAQTLKLVTDFLGNGINVVWSPDETRLATVTRFSIYIWKMP